MSEKPRIALVTGLWSENNPSAFQACLKLINILEPLSSQLSWLVTNQSFEGPPNSSATLVRIKSRYVPGAFLRIIFYHLLHQTKIILAMLKLIRNSKIDVFVFAFGTYLLILPMLLSRFRGKKLVMLIDDRPSVITRKHRQKPSRVKIVLYSVIEKIAYSLAHRIAPIAKSMVDLYGLQKYSSKISSGNLYVDTFVFQKTKGLAERTYDVGYIGRYSEEKGALELVESLPLITTNRQIRAIMIGDGHLKNKIENLLAKNDIQANIDSIGWVEHEAIAHYLNDMRMVVIPSYYEGLPHLVLESIACGTPVLATPVGAIPDVIRDGYTGFIMENNSPECIARNVVRVLNHPDLEQITTNACAVIEKEYSYAAALERFRNILTTLNAK
jgi:glycosyltransferase involved in cell wall biosynthesis